MLAQLRRLLLFTGAVLLFACALVAQVTTLEGSVKDENGQPLKGAVIKLERTDIKGHYQVKSDKKGHWFYTGLPLGTYNISCEVDGKVVDKVSNVKSKYGDSTTVDFDAGRMKKQQAAAQQAAQTGQLTDDQARGMSAEQKAALEKQVKERSESMKKNKALNDEFNAGKTAMDAKDYATAEQHFQKAGELDPARLRSGRRWAIPNTRWPKPSPRRRTKQPTTKLPKPTRKLWRLSRMTQRCITSWATFMAPKAGFRKRRKPLPRPLNSIRKWRPKPTTTWAPTW